MLVWSLRTISGMLIVLIHFPVFYLPDFMKLIVVKTFDLGKSNVVEIRYIPVERGSVKLVKLGKKIFIIISPFMVLLTIFHH